MRLLTSFAHGSIPLDEDRAGSVDAAEIGVRRSNDCVEVSLGCARDVVAAIVCPGIGIDDYDVPARELEWPRMDAGKAELEQAARPVSEQLEDPRRRGGGESGREPMHRYARYMSTKHTGKFLGVPYDWRRPTWERYKSRWWNTKDHRIVMPRAFGWGYDFNLAEVARRLHIRG
jgi:hypothetical protein